MDIVGLIPQFGGLIWTLLAFVIALSVIVAIHEYGHYIVGRWCGIKADVFSLGFGPVIWSGMDKRGTKWQIAALPFGGYVKFAGDANAASGKDEAVMAAVAENPKAARHTMHGAPLWARAATVAAGPVFNFALSILIFFGVALGTGVARDPLTVGDMRVLPQGAGGLQAGDEIVAVEGSAIPKSDPAYSDFIDSLPKTPMLSYDVRRDGRQVSVDGPYLLPPVVLQVVPQSAAISAGLAAGDVITGIDGTSIYAFDELKAAVESSDGAPLALDVWRDGEALAFTMTPKVVDEPQDDGTFKRALRIGIAGGMAFDVATDTPSIGMALSGGVQNTWRIITGSLSGLREMIIGNISTCNLSGPVGIAQTSGAMASQGAQSFIYFIAVLSTAVGLLNLFPIPALDGGHLTFFAYEAVTGKPPSDKALRVLMTIGLTLVLCLMVFALGNDLFCP
ncbi:RIP metalloprotease RseP [Sulfitobacter sp. M57]|uniref:RIP metalloprotease RseP n=1 Tax=unclassified Sulfitobacter TaxID=196795 RepID=UPI0023E0DEC5|nr:MULTISPECIES: RIP metalloprotease RseP [unclassified Sulfitobacter]MDF3413646.1 RIP metalloprotease RseP [Sulfitobacter sp. KE5]MDF3421073.1 RIP metalloprotease RseP [Sulfitobacter sp. KE43]MDF3432192.1 RIP metalloprotease RseP [Sulfitobacter sp. KE42]MDF3457831.1 RIP metalloprotease RseP [Sulfitobacter sp. S74]MDF3461732.1 RIP metalloprotease RseP [Sulfitobacter sp. Ks18]